MRQVPAERTTAQTVLDRAMRQPNGRIELVAGKVVAISPERAGHAIAKLGVAGALERSIAASGMACEDYPDGMSVLVDAASVDEPDALV